MAKRKKKATKRATKKTTKRRKRASLESPEPADIYGLNDREVETFSTGCTTLDCVLGGGWALGRMANVVGDKSSGKTLLAIEACANFLLKYPKGEIDYCETEAAFDKAYARAIGMPVDKINFPNDDGGILTVEDLFEDLERKAKRAQKTPALYIVDSLDALSDRKEMERKIDEGTYGAAKAKLLSQLFRRLNQLVEKGKITVLVISQTRENIGVTFGKSSTRSGGKALDFYASQILWLAHIARLKKTVKKVERVIGVNVRAKCEKNKVGPAFRECDFPIYFNYGIEDALAGLDFLKKIKRLDAIDLPESKLTAYKNGLAKMEQDDYREELDNIRSAVIEVWRDIEEGFKPTRSKY